MKKFWNGLLTTRNRKQGTCSCVVCGQGGDGRGCDCNCICAVLGGGAGSEALFNQLK